MIRTLIALAALSLATTAAASTLEGSGPSRLPAPQSSVFLNLEFARPGGFPLFLDLYLPTGSGPYPVIVSVHGGSWTDGDRTEGTAVLQVARGYAVANIDYRLAPTFTSPAQIEDVKAAVRWLRANATQYDLDPDKIGVMGYSAGGYLAVLLGTSAGVADLEGADEGNAGESSRVEAVVDYFGPTDLMKIGSEALPCEPWTANDPSAPDNLLMGCTDIQCPGKFAEGNPLAYVTADDPPFFIIHGTGDCLVPWQQSQDLYDALKAANVEATLHLVPFVGHADPTLFLLFQNQVNEFLDRHLKRPDHRVRAIAR